MAAAAITNTFTAATSAVASQVNRNFTDLVDFANDDTVHRDGSKPFTGDMSMGSYKVTNVAAGTAANDAVNVAQLSDAVPTGFIGMHGAASAPTGWLLCDGSLYSRTGYADLFAVIGTNFGAGDGSTTFAVPSFTNKFPYGDPTPGTTGGSNDAVTVSHTHTMGTHNHTIAHTHTIDPPSTDGFSATGWKKGLVSVAVGSTGIASTSSGAVGTWNINLPAFTSSASSATNSGSTDPGDTNSSGVSGTNKNRPAFVGVNFIIKSGV